MAFNGAFTVTSLIVPGSFVINDTSTGSDGNISTRRIYLYQADGTLLTGNFINFPLTSGSSITLNVLTQDYDLLIIVQWVSSSPLPPPSAYSASGLFNFVGNSRQFLDQLIGSIQSNPGIVQNSNFWMNLGIVQTEIDNSIQAALTGQQASAQRALNNIQHFIVNQTYLF